jgi:hypothetical protein
MQRRGWLHTEYPTVTRHATHTRHIFILTPLAVSLRTHDTHIYLDPRRWLSGLMRRLDANPP